MDSEAVQEQTTVTDALQCFRSGGCQCTRRWLSLFLHIFLSHFSFLWWSLNGGSLSAFMLDDLSFPTLCNPVQAQTQGSRPGESVLVYVCVCVCALPRGPLKESHRINPHISWLALQNHPDTHTCAHNHTAEHGRWMHMHVRNIHKSVHELLRKPAVYTVG